MSQDIQHIMIKHVNYTENPTNKSCKEQSMAQHMITKHPGLKPDLEFEILFLNGILYYKK